MSSFDIYPATILESPQELREVLTSAVVDRQAKEPAWKDIDEILSSVPISEEEMQRKYTIVARSAGDNAILGMMSLKEPDTVMRSFSWGVNPVEITNAYVLKPQAGIGSALVKHLEDKAQADGRTDIVLVSGPRFELSGWPFWRRMYGEPVGTAKLYFEGKYDGNVWHKPLAEAK